MTRIDQTCRDTLLFVGDPSASQVWSCQPGQTLFLKTLKSTVTRLLSVCTGKKKTSIPCLWRPGGQELRRAFFVVLQKMPRSVACASPGRRSSTGFASLSRLHGEAKRRQLPGDLWPITAKWWTFFPGSWWLAVPCPPGGYGESLACGEMSREVPADFLWGLVPFAIVRHFLLLLLLTDSRRRSCSSSKCPILSQQRP